MSQIEKKSNFYSQISLLLTNRAFLLNLLAIGLFITIVIFGILQWLKVYTNHGQKLEMPDYVETHIDDALNDADDRSFVMIVNDSVHIVGKPGGIIQNQNPKGGSLVKENRKIYVTTTKYSADVIDIASVFPLYGQDYESKKNQLQQKAIAAEIKEFKYDNLTTGSILEVWDGNKLIISQRLNPDSYTLERGSRLSFVVSTPEGGSFDVPDVIGLTYNRAKWAIENSKFRIGEVTYANDLGVDDKENAIVVEQYPVADGSKLTAGASINIKVKAP